MVLLGLNPSFTEANWNTWITQTMKYFSSSNSWEEYQFTLTADTHSFVFSGREINAKLDYFYLIPRDDPPPAPLPPTRFMIGTGQTMVISPTTGGCQVIIE
jgi:hypothetical protein